MHTLRTNHDLSTSRRTALATLALAALLALAPASAAAQQPVAAEQVEAAPDPTLDAEPLEAEAMALLEGLAEALAGKLPDVDAALEAAAAYNEQHAAEAERIGTALREIKAQATPEQRAAWVERARTRFEPELAAWRQTFVRFEQRASDAQIVELNALVKKLTAPMRMTAR